MLLEIENGDKVEPSPAFEIFAADGVMTTVTASGMFSIITARFEASVALLCTFHVTNNAGLHNFKAPAFTSTDGGLFVTPTYAFVELSTNSLDTSSDVLSSNSAYASTTAVSPSAVSMCSNSMVGSTKLIPVTPTDPKLPVHFAPLNTANDNLLTNAGESSLTITKMLVNDPDTCPGLRRENPTAAVPALMPRSVRPATTATFMSLEAYVTISETSTVTFALVSSKGAAVATNVAIAESLVSW
mmetsp:Transcript_44181/g.75188  ORF Transcript_44181/g.75188 Transcript_44181/m.75188 type:complete len:243 (-) Transcript_44181:12-740(-)